MEWRRLLNESRVREHSEPKSPLDGRNEFENDYTRLVFSSAVRRLQDKAQVFPLEQSDFVRTRLTHSIEVSAIGRSIGASVETELINRRILDRCHQGKISSLLAAVGLVHDLGNPPFGHFGETSIQSFFKDLLRDDDLGLTWEEQEDLRNFEGNAQTFRLMTKLQYLVDNNGFNLSFGTLAAMLKYPRSSVEGNKDKSPNISYKKFGYFQSESDIFRKTCEETGVDSYRHPIAFLLEAADDIAYSAADIEDGFKKKVLDFSALEDVLGQNLNLSHSADVDIHNSLEKYLKGCHPDYPHKKEIAVQRFRIKAQGFMIKSVVEAFVEKHDALMKGEFDKDILITSRAGRLRKGLKELATNYIFGDKGIITVELAGNEVIQGLLRIFTQAVLSDQRNKPKTLENKVYNLISPNYRFICEYYPYKRTSSGEPSVYDRLLLVTDHICGMTDSYAVEMSRKLRGVKL